MVTANDIPKYDAWDSDGARVELPNGWTARVKCEPDPDTGPPWKEHDGHGAVRTTRATDMRRVNGYNCLEVADKQPGERILNPRAGLYNTIYLYDYAGAVATARKDGWGCSHVNSAEDRATFGGHPTARAMAACAADADYQRMRDWCEDRWSWIGVTVELFDADGERVEPAASASDSLWGIESDGDYWREVAAELVNGLAAGLVLPNFNSGADSADNSAEANA